MSRCLTEPRIRQWFITFCLLLCSVQHPLAADSPYTSGLRKVRALAASRRYDSAIELLTKLMFRYPNNPELLAYRGRVYLWNGMPASAALDFKRSLRLSPDPQVRRELVMARDLLVITRAEYHLAMNEHGTAASLVRPIFDAGRQRYRTGLILGRALTASGDHAGAAEVYTTLSREFPRDRDLISASVRAYIRAGLLTEAKRFLEGMTGDDPPLLEAQALLAEAWGAYDDALDLYRRAALKSGSDEMRQQVERLERQNIARLAEAEALRVRLVRAELLARAERHFANGEWEKAESIWWEIYRKGDDRYTPGVKLAASMIRRGEHLQAVQLLLDLTARYPNDADLGLMLVDAQYATGNLEGALQTLNRPPLLSGPQVSLRRGRILARQRHYDEALDAYAEAGADHDPDVAREREQVETDQMLAIALELMRSGRLDDAMQLWERLFTSGRNRYEAGYHLGSGYMRQRQFGEARRLFVSLSDEFPSDTGIYALALETTLLERDIDAAIAMVNDATPERFTYLAENREDLVFAVHPNFLRVSGMLASYDTGYGLDRGGTVTLSQRIGTSTLLLDAGYQRRYGLDDFRLGGELFFPVGNNREMTGDVAVGWSPTAEVLPDFSFRAEISRRFGELEGSAGYSRLQFGGDGTDILIVGLLGYPAPHMSLGERIYLVPEKGTFSFLTTLRHEPSHQWSWIFSVGIGTASDRFGVNNDLKRYATLSFRGGVEHRPVHTFSTGGDLFLEYRNTLYTRVGGELFVKWWW